MSSIAFIVAGGASRRMGLDKLRLPRSPRMPGTILDHVIQTGLQVADAVYVLSGTDYDTNVPAPFDRVYGTGENQPITMISDNMSYQGPLYALAQSWLKIVDKMLDGVGKVNPLIYALAGDLPGIQPQVLQSCAEVLLAHPKASAALVVRQGRSQPLLGCYRADVGQIFKRAVENGERRLMASLVGLEVVTVDAQQRGWPEWWTRPIHTPEDYQAWWTYAETENVV